MALDHGVLNVALSKRGNIDSQIDRYKEQQAQSVKATRKEIAARAKEAKQVAKQLLEDNLEGILAKHGAKFGEKALKEMLVEWSKVNPSKLVSFVEKFKAENN